LTPFFPFFFFDPFFEISGDIKDEELQFIDPLVDDRVINMILSYDGYSPAMRDGLTFTYINNPFSRD